IQRRIGEILGSFDAKIELNRRMNTTLEQIATALFKSWFVNFDPFKDGEFVKSELGLIPKGWKVVTIGEIATITSGKRPGIVSTKKKSDFEIPLIGASGVMGYVQQALSQSPILVTGRVGTLGIVRKYNIPIWSSDNTLNFTTNYFEYVLQILRNTNFKNLNRGSTQPLITQTDIKSIKIIFPEEKILTLFEQICLSYSDAVEHNRIESQTLAAIRDTLLPKLMSGEISVT
ncbi:MAG: restriction endonuclease subunit S, partial [Planctomycetaceae bacterium]|nr:restriction endonuclease subunit S [Planctomycetaceae bacterium]